MHNINVPGNHNRCNSCPEQEVKHRDISALSNEYCEEKQDNVGQDEPK
jgi:hypothetical protein